MSLLVHHRPLDPSQYFPEARTKQGIVIHHTAGASAESTIRWWAANEERIGTAYLVERDGSIYQCFKAECWAYHLGLKSANRKLIEASTIGIEICSEGGLQVDEQLAPGAGPTRYLAFGKPFTGAVESLPVAWRGYRHFAAYTPLAIASTFDLIHELLERFPGVPRVVAHDHGSPLEDFQGVSGHCQWRADKTDPHPGFPWDRLRDEVLR